MLVFCSDNASNNGESAFEVLYLNDLTANSSLFLKLQYKAPLVSFVAFVKSERLVPTYPFLLKMGAIVSII